ncbi:MAG: hypothetical protein RL172_833 [Bacteroidota bacterium]|jgi:hypothetical protein
MQLICKEYLLDILSRKLQPGIHLHRRQYPFAYNLYNNAPVTQAELENFISTMPCLDEHLKAFLLNDTGMQTIISQAWETEFFKQCHRWMNGQEWLYAKHPATSYMPAGDGVIKKLSLPF